MSIDIVAPGRCIDIRCMHEQAWFELDPAAPNALTVTEVYDCFLENPEGSPPLESVSVLLPHHCGSFEKGELTTRIEAQVVVPSPDLERQRYDWWFAQEPQEGRREEVVSRTYAADYGHDFSATVSGKALVAQIGFPSRLSPRAADVLAQGCLSWVELRFQPLLGGEGGWFRLVVAHARLDAGAPRARNIPGTSCAFQFDQRLSVPCAELVRDKALHLLGDYMPLASKEAALLRARLWHDIGETFLGKGTSTRVEDHRIALVVTGPLDISDICCSPGATFHGTIPFMHECLGVQWSAGSIRNRNDDLIHNAQRVIDYLSWTGQQGDMGGLVRDLAPSGRYEAFMVLVQNMLAVGLIGNSGGKPVLPSDWKPNLKRRLVALRQAYLDPEAPDQNLRMAFRDLHPFRIDFRISWMGLVPESKRSEVLGEQTRKN